MKPFPVLMQVEAEFKAPVASAQLVRFNFEHPIDLIAHKDDSYRVDLCLSPRPQNARACYPDHWHERRFERIGNLFLVPPSEALHTKSEGCCEQSSMLCQFNPGAMRTLLDEDLSWSDPQLMAGLDVRDANIQGLMLRLVQEAKQPGFASEMLVELISAQMAIELARFFSNASKPAGSGGLSAWRLRAIDERLREVREAPSLTELAELCHLSVRQLTRGFRSSRGASIGDYVANSRVDHAKALLGTDCSIKSIAYTLGFASPSSFCFAFRRATGETPGYFRQRLQRIH